MTDRKLEIEVRLAQQGIKADADRAAAVIKGALDGQRFDIDINADDREVKLLQLALKDVADETEATRRQARFLKEAYNLDDSQVRQVLRQMERLQKTTDGAKKEASGLDAAISGLAAGAAFAVIDRLVDGLTQLIASAGSFIKSSLDARAASKGWANALEAILGSSEAAKEELQFVRDTVDDVGGNLEAAANNFTQFTAAADSAGISQGLVRDVFAETQRVLGVLNVDTERQNLAFTALTQIASKGQLSMEELRGQLGEQLPVALAKTAEGLGVSTDKLIEMISQGEITAAEFFPAFLSGLQALEGQIDPTQKAIGQLTTRVFDLKDNLGAALEPLQNAGLESLATIFDIAGAESEGLDKLAAAGERLRDTLRENPELLEELGLILADVVDTAVELTSGVLDDISDFLENNPDEIGRQGEEIRKLLASIGQIAPLISQLIGTLVKVGIAADKNFAAPLRAGGRIALNVLGRVNDLAGSLISQFNRLRQAILGAKEEAAELDQVAATTAAGGATGAADNLTTREDAEAEARVQREQQIEERRQLEEQALQERITAEEAANEAIAESTETVAERQKAAREELKQARLEALQEEFDAEKGALEVAESLLSAQNSLQSTLGTLEQERVKTQIAAAEAANDEVAAAQLKEQLKALEIEQEAKAFEFKRKALDLQLQQNRLEAELALAKAKTNDASAEEIALLQRQLSLVDELGALQRQNLDAEQQIAQERRQQGDLRETARANEEAAKAAEQAAADREAKIAEKTASTAESVSPSAAASPNAVTVASPDPDELPATGPRYFLNGQEVSVQEYLGQGANPLAGVGPNPAVTELGQVAGAGGQSGGMKYDLGPLIGEVKGVRGDINEVKGLMVQMLSTPGNLTIERFDDQELVAEVLQAYGDKRRGEVNV